MDEFWEDIPGHEGYYQVSNLGRIRSLDRILEVSDSWGKRCSRKFKGKILSPHSCSGCNRVRLYTSDGMYEHRSVSSIYKEVFPESL